MALERYEPRSLLAQFNDEMNRVFGDATGTLPMGSPLSGGAWRPAVDIHENDDAYLIDVEVPGIDPKDVEITLNNDVLTLSGERVERSDNAEKSVQREGERAPARHVERRYGRFMRRFTLPETADEDAVEARAEHGVLHITVPKKEQSRPRRIEVKDASASS
ncbi:Hsp20/alpha crystallin family protein [Salinisphaera sp. LB1]|uniref:Hsp20/alpha crystallin family protein n=1 Tax=Salinisphaera sp. LB1 TaxID=2183911 RepID=UPI000D705FCC|nr:Hsp20/alpha crystallin family protein [Salinisphaera sp. LB1]AWN17188.1 Heat shock protein, Hsp20 family [Salinisphaera sp. LB1]